MEACLHATNGHILQQTLSNWLHAREMSHTQNTEQLFNNMLARLKIYTDHSSVTNQAQGICASKVDASCIFSAL